MAFLHYLIVFCLLLQSFSFRVPIGDRKPSSIANFESLKAKMAEYKVKIMGSEHDGKCSEAEINADFDKLMASLKKDSCTETDFNLDKEEFTKQACPKIKKKGIFDQVVNDIISQEKSSKKPSAINSNDPDINRLYNEALKFKNELKIAFSNRDLNAEEVVDLSVNYVENILMPFRDLVVIKRSYLSVDYINGINLPNLQLQIPAAFFHEFNNDQLNLLTQGPNPSAEPFYLELIPSINGDYTTLSIAPSDIIRRDVLTLMKAPTSKNYVQALKWMTLHMMLSQVFLYDTVLGNKNKLVIPNSCQNHFNGNLPNELNFKVEDGVGDQFLENILMGHGLSYKQDDSAYLDYYVDNINRDPTKEGYSGLVPFENYKNAKVGSIGKFKGALEAELDDVANFQSILNLKKPELEALYRGKIKSQDVLYAGYDDLPKFLGEFSADETADILMKDGTKQSIYPGKQNLSPFLLEIMKRKKVTDYADLIPSDLKAQMSSNHIKLEFPSMYSSPVWRDWSLKVLADIFYKYQDLPNTSDLHHLVDRFCSYGSVMMMGSQISACAGGNRVKNLADLLAEFRSGEKYIPTRRLEEKKFQSIYPLLKQVWNSLRDQTSILEEAKPTEWDFLQDQMSAGNPWARLKISYMVMMANLNSKEKTDKEVCDQKIINTEINKMSNVGKILGLNIPLTNNHAEHFLSKSEKTYLWNTTIDEIQHRNAQLFSVQTSVTDYYKLVEDISYKTILTPDAALNSGVPLTAKTKKMITDMSKSTEAQLGDFFLKLYSLKGDTEKQKSLFEEFSKKNGIDNTFNLKLNFLALDEAYKKPIYKDLLRQAAQTRKSQIINQLDTFCALDINDHKGFKNIFYSTTKAQNELNQMAGLPTIPAGVMKAINEMSPDEFRDMWWGIGSGVAGMAAIVVGGACTALSGGICAPLGGAMAAMGLASLGIQVKLTANEYERKLDADESEKKVKTMEELGFANIGSSDEVHRSIAWTAFEAISIFPLIGVASRSVAIGPKLAYVSIKSMMHETGKESFRVLAKGAIQEEEVRLARYVLGVDSVSKELGVDAAATKISKIKKLYTSGAIDFETMLKRTATILEPFKNAKLAIAKTLKKEFGEVVIKESPAQIDQQTSRLISRYFSDNPREFYRVIHSYSGGRLNRAVNIMNEINAKTRIGKRIPIYSGVRDWFMRMRNESLAKNANKILRIEKELEAMGSGHGKLEQYIFKNMEDLTDIFIDIPMRKREIPFVIQIQGLPEFTFINGRKIPLLSMMSEGQTLKKYFNARARLVYESYKSQARSILKLKRFVQADTTFSTFKAFQLSVAEMANQKSGVESAQILARYKELEEKMAKELFDEYLGSGNKMEYSAFKQLVFSPQNLKEEATAHAIWESIPADKLLGMKDAGEFAHQAVRELANYNDIDSFNRYLSALKVLIINRNPAVLDLM